jgi:hypothetical protein
MKNKKIKTKTGPAPTSVGTGLLQHYWNNDSTKTWSIQELEEAAGDTSTLQPLLEAGHHPFPGWHDFTCETRLFDRGALFRIFDHAPSLYPPRPYGPKHPTGTIEGIPPGVLYAVAGVAADTRSAAKIWQLLRRDSAPLYSADEAGFGTLNGRPVASVFHACTRPSRPRQLPWLSFMAYNPVLHDHQLYYPDCDTPILWIAKEWLHASVRQRSSAEKRDVVAW